MSELCYPTDSYDTFIDAPVILEKVQPVTMSLG